ncbi:MAG: protein-glutamate O-methyltransferase CheR [Desulfobaccales bacterium]
MSKVWLDTVLEELRRVRGLDLSDYRRPTLERRLAARMANLRLNDPGEYLQRLRSDPSECDRLIETIDIKVSSFFRDPLVFEFLAHRVLPLIMERHRRQHTRQIRVWSAGCAAGEEPYSVAILLAQALEDEDFPWLPYICATDISPEALAAAQTRSYRRESLETTQLGILDRFFRPTADGFEVIPEIRRMVQFSRDDLTSRHSLAPADSVFGSFDLVLCRNVLIYFTLDLQKRVQDKLYGALNPGGYLVLGMSESLPPKTASRLIAVDQPCRIFQKSG